MTRAKAHRTRAVPRAAGGSALLCGLLAVGAAAMVLLGACHTIEGIGRDVSSLGAAMSGDDAETPRRRD
jgi:predicted small secreted protein